MSRRCQLRTTKCSAHAPATISQKRYKKSCKVNTDRQNFECSVVCFQRLHRAVDQGRPVHPVAWAHLASTTTVSRFWALEFIVIAEPICWINLSESPSSSAEIAILTAAYVQNHHFMRVKTRTTSKPFLVRYNNKTEEHNYWIRLSSLKLSFCVHIIILITINSLKHR